jgi:hypothetical protein
MKRLLTVVATIALLSFAFGLPAQANLIYELEATSLFGAIAAPGVNYQEIAEFTDDFGPLAFDTHCSFSFPPLCLTFTGDTSRYVSSSNSSFGTGDFSVALSLGALLMTGIWNEDGLFQNWHGHSDASGVWSFTLFSDRYSCGVNSTCGGTGRFELVSIDGVPVPEPSSLAVFFGALLTLGVAKVARRV